MTWLLPPLPPNWAAALRDVDAQRVEARIAAATRLGQPADDTERAQAFTALLRSLEDRDARVRGAAVQALAELGGDRVIELLQTRLTDGNALVRELATLGLSDQGWEQAGEVLLGALRSQYPEVRFQAFAAAAMSGDGRVGWHVLRALEDEDRFVRAGAAHAAGLLDPDARPASLVGKLRAALNDPEHAVRSEAGIALARLGEVVAVDALLSALDEGEHRLEALEVAPQLADPRVRERVAFMAGSVLGSRLVAAAAGRALVRMGDPRGIAALRGVLGAWRTQGRALAVQAIGELGIAELAPEVIRVSLRPRGVEPGVLAGCLAALAGRMPEAGVALRRMGKRDDAFGLAAREEESGHG